MQKIFSCKNQNLITNIKHQAGWGNLVSGHRLEQET